MLVKGSKRETILVNQSVDLQLDARQGQMSPWLLKRMEFQTKVSGPTFH